MKTCSLMKYGLLPQILAAMLLWRLFAADSPPLPVDPAVTMGTLPNGLRYYLRENRKPENRASLRLVVNTGSMTEDDDQQGLAHFIEHMAFNGTEHFAKQELVDFLEGIGMRFGPELNAYTGFDETVYMLEIPMDDEEILEKAFLILQDWASGIAFDPEELEKERGVIVEEWRLGRGAEQRVFDKQVPVLFHQSRYAERLPIGKVEVIKSAPREALLRYYRNWYRPDLMAVIAVGDFKRQDIEARLRKYFEPLRNPEHPPKRLPYPVPDHAETLFSIETDPELRSTSVLVAYKHPSTHPKTIEDYRRSLVENLYTSMLNERLDERRQEANPPFLFAGLGKTPLVRTKDVFLQRAVVKEGEFAEGLRTMLIEARRVKGDGFTATELERTKADLLRSYEQAYAERDKHESSSFAAEYARNFLTDEPIPGIEKETELVKELLPGVTLDQVNQAARTWITATNRVILYSAPEKPQLEVPTREQILAVMKTAEAETLEAYRDTVADVPLISEEPRPGKVAAEQFDEATGVTTWTLSNGVRVLLKPTDFQNDEILLQAFSPGGHSLVSDEDHVAAVTAGPVVSQSGVGQFDQIELRKKLAGKIVGVGPSISESFEGLNGSASPRDAETLFQLMALQFTAPRADEKAFGSLQTRMRNIARNRLNSPAAVFSDEVEKRLYRDHFRHRPLTLEWIEEMDREKSLRIYRERFADASDFTFVFVGNLDLERMKPLVERYLASLPSLGRKEEARFNGDDPARGRVEVVVHKGIEPKSSVTLTFTGDAPWSDEARYPLRAAVDALRIRLREVLREDKGGTYGVSVSGELNRWPKETYSSGISLGCDPGKVDELIDTALAEVERFQEEGPDPETLAKVKEIHLRTHEKGLKENGYWMANLVFRARHGLAFQGILDFPEKPEKLTADIVKQAAQRYFCFDNLLVGRLFPEEAHGAK